MKLDSITVRLLLAIAEEGSISRAAETCRLAVAAASRRLSELEAQLGVALFERKPHGVKLTVAGEQLLRHVHQIDSLVHRLRDDARALGRGSEGRVIIGAPKAAIMQFLGRDLANVQSRYPGIALKVVEENSKIIQQLLRDKVIDIGIYEQTLGFLNMPRHAYRNDHLALIHHPGFFHLGSGPVSIEQLMDLPIVCLGRGSAILAAVQRTYQLHGRHFQDDLTVSGFDTMLALVREGLGIGLIPPGVARRLDPAGELRQLELAGNWHQRHYVLSSVEGRAQRLALERVVDTLLHP
ncbi:LysR family transcriptional regulator [Paracandidimonas soli]|nr:LysR family transcriptional regulator [Paracandidimonas soli]